VNPWPSKQVKEYRSLDVLKLANQYLMPIEVSLAKVDSKMDQAHCIDGSNILASDNYIGQVQSSVINCFKSLTEPALIQILRRTLLGRALEAMTE
jgi:hypothetical protein